MIAQHSAKQAPRAHLPAAQAFRRRQRLALAGLAAALAAGFAMPVSA